MKYGIFSDVHANYGAMKTVVDDLRKEGVDQLVFLGDIVGYGGEPKECLRFLMELEKEHRCLCVAGNHDHAVGGRTDYSFYYHLAREAIDWTKTQLTGEEAQYLADMVLVRKTDDLTAVHANLESPEDWGYVFDIDDAFPNFKLLENRVCFIGHSHKPLIFVYGEMVDWFLEEKIVLEEGKKYIINVGSVGQPRDGNPKASYAVYDAVQKTVQLKRTAYDIRGAQKKIIEAGLPRVLAERLAVGK